MWANSKKSNYFRGLIHLLGLQLNHTTISLTSTLTSTLSPQQPHGIISSHPKLNLGFHLEELHPPTGLEFGTIIPSDRFGVRSNISHTDQSEHSSSTIDNKGSQTHLIELVTHGFGSPQLYPKAIYFTTLTLPWSVPSVCSTISSPVSNPRSSSPNQVA